MQGFKFYWKYFVIKVKLSSERKLVITKKCRKIILQEKRMNKTQLCCSGNKKPINVASKDYINNITVVECTQLPPLSVSMDLLWEKNKVSVVAAWLTPF